jgi:hypothetical protein
MKVCKYATGSAEEMGTYMSYANVPSYLFLPFYYVKYKTVVIDMKLNGCHDNTTNSDSDSN